MVGVDGGEDGELPRVGEADAGGQAQHGHQPAARPSGGQEGRHQVQEKDNATKS